MSEAVPETGLRSSLATVVLTVLSRDQLPEVQRALSQYASLLDNISEEHMIQFDAELRAIGAALSGEKPNTLFAERTIAAIDNSMMVSRGLFSKWLYRSTNGSPILAVYGALVLS